MSFEELNVPKNHIYLFKPQAKIFDTMLDMELQRHTYLVVIIVHMYWFLKLFQ